MNSDNEIYDMVQNILECERNKYFTIKEIKTILENSNLIHEGRKWGSSDTDFLTQVINYYDKEII